MSVKTNVIKNIPLDAVTGENALFLWVTSLHGKEETQRMKQAPDAAVWLRNAAEPACVTSKAGLTWVDGGLNNRDRPLLKGLRGLKKGRRFVHAISSAFNRATGLKFVALKQQRTLLYQYTRRRVYFRLIERAQQPVRSSRAYLLWLAEKQDDVRNSS